MGYIFENGGPFSNICIWNLEFICADTVNQVTCLSTTASVT